MTPMAIHTKHDFTDRVSTKHEPAGDIAAHEAEESRKCSIGCSFPMIVFLLSLFMYTCLLFDPSRYLSGLEWLLPFQLSTANTPLGT